MNDPLTRKAIQELCGAVSLKRGEIYRKNKKVTFQEYKEGTYIATVHGNENFQVKIAIDSLGKIECSCTCPKLSSFQKECQHVAAVLLTIQDIHVHENTAQTDLTAEHPYSEELLAIFEKNPVPSIMERRHFEKRTVLPVQFHLHIVEIDNEKELIGICMYIANAKVEEVRPFLAAIQRKEEARVNDTQTYDPFRQCFSKNDEMLILELIKVVEDERLYFNGEKALEGTKNRDVLWIPPSSWRYLLSIIEKVQAISWNETEVAILSEMNFLTFLIRKSGTNYVVEVNGMEKVHFLHLYQCILVESTIIPLNLENFHRLVELYKMMEKLERKSIPIHEDQIDYFIEKVVPGLKKLGTVKLENELLFEKKQHPLEAKLYLDRVNNRLLASLEFHYDATIINPVEEVNQAKAFLFRDKRKEKEILTIIDKSSFAKTDSGYILYNEELEYDFLYNELPKLQKLLKVYATTAVRNRIVKEKVFPKFRIRVQKERMNWLHFTFEIEGFPEKEIKGILAALEEKRKYYRLQNGALFSLQTREMEEIQRFLHSPVVQNKDFISGFELTFLEGLSIISEDRKIFNLDDSYQKLMESLKHPKENELRLSNKWMETLKEYQKTGVKWMKKLAEFGFGGVLADDMGLGKTIQSIAYIESAIQVIRERKCPVLVVCPTAVLYNWQQECERFAPELVAVVVDGNVKERSTIQKELAGVDVIITSYSLLRMDILFYEGILFHTIFFDEAQSFKNPTTQTFRAVKRLKANYRFALTGTPIENSIEELWSIFHIVFPQLFNGLKEFSYLRKKQINDMIQPFMLRRLKQDVLQELPEKRVHIEKSELLLEQKHLYGAYLAKLRHDTLKHLDKKTLRKNKIRILAGITRLRQICCHPALFVENYHGDSAKLNQLLEWIDRCVESNRRVLIFSQFTGMLKLIGRELVDRNIPYFYLDGSTPADDRLDLCRQYNIGEKDFFLISLKAGGTGLNLMTADTVIFYDSWWNPAVEEQAADRAHRMGQINEVEVIKLVAKGTIEEKINELQEKKRVLIDEVIDSDNKIWNDLTEEEIMALIEE